MLEQLLIVLIGISKYYFTDVVANLLFVWYIFVLPKDFRKSMLIAFGGCCFQVLFSFLVGSIPNILSSIFFCSMYLRSYILYNKQIK